MKKIKLLLWRAKQKLQNSRLIRNLSDFYESYFNSYSFENSTTTKSGWSIVVITSGKSNDTLSQLVKSAENELLGTPSEIIIIGPKSTKLDYIPQIKIKHIIYREMGLAPGWITRKKNLGVSAADFDKVAVCHDYVIFVRGWKDGFDKFGNDFEVCINKITNNDGTRFRDWITWDYPGLGPGLLPYTAKCNQYQIISGTFFIVKKDFYMDNPLDEKLRWGEGEDAEWSIKIRKKTDFKLNLNSVTTFSKQKINVHGNWLDNSLKLERIFRS